jgi:hydrogenase nickel incorporation protein HypA/HybF
MHETTIMERIVRAVLREMGRRGASSVESIEVEVGELEGVRMEDLKRAFDLRVRDTPLEETILHVTILPAKVFCGGCGRSKVLRLSGAEARTDLFPTCPDCRSPLDIEGGRGFTVRSATMVVPA